MRVLITGMSGFAGSALSQYLLDQTYWMLIGMASGATGDRASGRVQWWQMDIRDEDGLRRFMRYERPDLVIHLAAQASVPKSWESPWETFETNVHGTLNIFDAVIKARLAPRILVVCSNEVYGSPASPDELPLTESSPLKPNNPYGVSKVAQESVALQYHYSHGLDVVIARPFNHIGPGQKPGFVVSEFARQIAEIEAGKREAIMMVGNMDARRDFTDVRDTVRAYYQLIRFADSGSTYNIASGKPRSIQNILDTMLSLTHAKIEIRSDPSKFRVVDTPVSYGDSSRIQRDCNWQPQIAFEQTIADILADWRQRVQAVDTKSAAG